MNIHGCNPFIDCLSWSQEFPNADDTYYLAHCYPYTFTDLRDDLDDFLNDTQRSKVLKREVMCETKAGNSCFLLTVTNFGMYTCVHSLCTYFCMLLG